jgi:hypothetical protein
MAVKLELGNEKFGGAVTQSRLYVCSTGKGSHEIWHSPITHKNISVPFTIQSNPTANAILRQAGINEKLCS